MNREQLKEALLDLMKQEPEFMNEIIAEVVKSSLSIDSASDGDYYNPGKTYVLLWKSDKQGCDKFSTAY